ncbi:MAG: hypothetical protein ACU84Q_03770 [Gammaproteobacteria bacterium]
MRSALAIVLTTCVLLAEVAIAQEYKIVPYEVRSKFREAGCEIVTVQEAMRTDLKLQSIYVATCSGLETYLMAVKCRGERCTVLQ